MVDIVAIVFEFWSEEASNGGRLFVVDKETNLCDNNKVVPWNIVLIAVSIPLGMVIGRRRTCLINFPMRDSDSPLLYNAVETGIEYLVGHTHLYMLAVSQVNPKWLPPGPMPLLEVGTPVEPDISGSDSL